MYRYYKLNCFTLAEVLITIGLIGIVAAMTMPGVIKFHKKKIIETRLKAFYSTTNQAVLLSENDNGSRMDWEKSCASGRKQCKVYMDKYFIPYFKTLKTEEDKNGYIKIYFPNGSLAVVKNGYDWYFYPFAKDFNESKLLATNDKGNIVREDNGKTYWTFQFTPTFSDAGHIYHYRKGVEPYRALRVIPPQAGDSNTEKRYPEYSKDLLLNDAEYGCNETAFYKVYCAALIQDNNWEIPDDYPLKF